MSRIDSALERMARPAARSAPQTPHPGPIVEATIDADYNGGTFWGDHGARLNFVQVAREISRHLAAGASAVRVAARPVTAGDRLR